jgi:bifunctional DNase/RNase
LQYVTEIEIYNLIDGVFHAKLVCEVDGETREIDARTSDSIALAVRFKCPIYTYEDIMETAGVVFNDEMDDVVDEPEQQASPARKGNELASKSSEQLEQLLEEALREEDYKRAAIIRDELNKRK